MNQQGVIEGVYKKDVKTRFGTKQTHSFKMDGAFFSCGFNDPRLAVGEEIAFEFTEGTYGKEVTKGTIVRTGAAPVAVPAPAAAAPRFDAPKSAVPSSNRVFPIPPLHGDRAIIRQNALNHASRLVATGLNPAAWEEVTKAGATVEQQVETIASLTISLARKFEAYACGDLDVARAKEIAAKQAVEKELS